MNAVLEGFKQERVLLPRVALSLTVVLLLLLCVVFYETASGMVHIWYRSGTFTHAFLVLPVSIWLLWERRASLLKAGFRPALLPLLFLAGAALLWLLGEAVSAAVVTHFAFVLMWIAVVWAVWGHAASWQAMFPLAFLFFMVPFGDFLVPTLMHYTAEFTVALVRLSGIPVYQEGQNFVIPSGRWSVVEACSGIRYLIASFMVGVLFAYLNYRSWGRRTLFVVASLLVPLLANWLRAWLIVMLGHFSGNTLAVGADHLVYGWVFFGLVIALLFWVGSFWRQDDLPLAEQVFPWVKCKAYAWPVVAVGVAALILLPRPTLSWLVNVPGSDVRSLSPVAAVSGWQVQAPDSSWRSLFVGERAKLVQGFGQAGRSALLQITYFARQSDGHELVQYDNRLLDSDDPLWHAMGPGRGVSVTLAGQTLQFEETEIVGAGGHRLVWRAYWLGELVTASDKVAKLDLLKSRLLRQADDSANVVLSVPVGESLSDAQALIRRFTEQQWGEIEASLRRAANPKLGN